MSVMAVTPPHLASMRWSSPTKPGTLVTETPVSSGVEQAREAGLHPITLGRRILRTETAGMAVLSILMFQLED